MEPNKWDNTQIVKISSSTAMVILLVWIFSAHSLRSNSETIAEEINTRVKIAQNSARRFTNIKLTVVQISQGTNNIQLESIESKQRFLLPSCTPDQKFTVGETIEFAFTPDSQDPNNPKSGKDLCYLIRKE